MVFISGQIGVGRDGKLVSGDFRAGNPTLKPESGAQAVGARFEHVVKLNNYPSSSNTSRSCAMCALRT